MSLNGALAGLVGITAPCNNVSPISAVMIGFLAGILVVFSVIAVDRMGVDDPVGAISVHGVCGAWGTLAAAIFHIEGFSWNQLGVQALGAAAAFLWTFPLAYLTFKVIKTTVGLRVSAEEEIEGLDVGEHGESAYPDFVLVVGAPSVTRKGIPHASLAYGVESHLAKGQVVRDV